MPTYRASNVNVPAIGSALAETVKALRRTIATTAALTTSDVFEFGLLPRGATIVGGFLEATDLDTGGSPTLTINIGDAGDADRYFAASTVGQAGTASTALAVSGLGFTTTAETLVTGAPAANAATGVAGSITLVLLYTV
jgi:hypothetical protein